MRHRVSLAQRGCGCRTGCKTARCKCRTNNHLCGPGCKCQGCTNLPLESRHRVADLDQTSTSESEESDVEKQFDDIMDEVFGDHLLAEDNENLIDMEELINNLDVMEKD